MLLRYHLLDKRLVAVPLGMAGRCALHEAVISLHFKHLVRVESGFGKLAVHIGGNHKIFLTLYHLHKGGTLRFGQIYKEMNDVSEKMLSATLKNLERDGLVRRKAYPEIPPRVEYSLTPLGESLMPHVDSLIGWAVEHFQDVTHGKVLV